MSDTKSTLQYFLQTYVSIRTFPCFQSGNFRMDGQDYMLEPADHTGERVKRDVNGRAHQDEYIVYHEASEDDLPEDYEGDYLRKFGLYSITFKLCFNI